MIVDGKSLAQELEAQLVQTIAAHQSALVLTVFVCEPTFETQKFLALKKRFAERIGVHLQLIECSKEMSTPELLLAVQQCLPHTNGVVVQLPFPERFEIETILSAIPLRYDVDALMYDGSEEGVLPPVVGAIRYIAQRHQVSFVNQRVTVVGNGRLVGAPAALWAKQQGAEVHVVTEASPDRLEHIHAADILILGAGVPALVTADMVRPGVLVFDAGTSEAAGVLCGDAAADVAEVAALLTPVPGGIGPLTVACLFQNLVTLAQRQ